MLGLQNGLLTFALTTYVYAIMVMAPFKVKKLYATNIFILKKYQQIVSDHCLTFILIFNLFLFTLNLSKLFYSVLSTSLWHILMLCQEYMVLH